MSPQSNQFNPLDRDNQAISGRQLTRAAQISQSSVMASGANVISGMGAGTQGRESNRQPDTAWYKIISETGLGVYVVRRQRWKVSTKAFVDAYNVTDRTAYETSNTVGIAVGKFFHSIREFEVAGAVVVLFKRSATVDPADDYKVKVSDNDTTPEFLDEKVTASGLWLTFAEVNDAGDEDWDVTHNLPPDTTGGWYLEVWVAAGSKTYKNGVQKDATVCAIRIDITGHTFQFHNSSAFVAWPTGASGYP